MTQKNEKELVETQKVQLKKNPENDWVKTWKARLKKNKKDWVKTRNVQNKNTAGLTWKKKVLLTPKSHRKMD